MNQSRLKELLSYNKETGLFIRLTDASNSTKIGDIAGGIGLCGYIHIRVDGKRMKAHRLAFLYMTGSMPKEVDHINHIKIDNRWDNLRPATRTEQNRNHAKRRDNSSDCTGVCWNKKECKWKARISNGVKRINLGTFEKYSEAVDARKLAEVAYGYHKNHGKGL